MRLSFVGRSPRDSLTGSVPVGVGAAFWSPEGWRSASPTAAGLAGFEADVRAIFKKLDGSGRKLSIDRFERDRPGDVR